MGDATTFAWAKALRRFVFAALFLAIFGAGYLLHGWLASSAGSGETAAHAHQAAGVPANEQAASLWTCAMHPQIRQPRPGKCPLCGMNLVPVTSTSGGLRALTLSPEAAKLMALATAPVERKYVTATVRMVGKVAYDETRLGYITAWVAGRLDRLYVDYTGVAVKKGDHMVYIYSPDLYSIQNELIQALQFAGSRKAAAGEVDLVESAREKLRLLGMTPEQIKEMEQRKVPSDHMTIYAPAGGIVVQKHFNQGDYVKVGDRIYAIADLSHVWVLLDAYESDLPWVRYGQEVTFTTEAYPGEQFLGRIAFVDPVLNDKTRTVKVRVNVSNPQGKLKPEMFVSGVVHSHIAAGGRVIDSNLAGKWISPMHPEIVKDQPGKCDICGMPLVPAEELGYLTASREKEAKPLVIPRSAALVTGTRAIVYVQLPRRAQPTYEGREIVLGPRAGDYYLVRSGLKEGDLVVTNGNFKLDSALQIQAKPSMMTPEGGGVAGHEHGGHGAGDTKQKESPGMPERKVPVAFHDQLQKLDDAYQDVASAMQEQDVGKLRSAFAAFGNALDAIDTKLLEGHARMLWDEFSMLLRNDVVEGREVKELPETRRVYGLLTDHMRRVREALHTAPTGHEGHSAPLTVPGPVQKQLLALLDAYVSLQQALAGDNLQKAQEAAGPFRVALSAVETKQLAEPARDAWQQQHDQLGQVVARLEQGKDLKALREEFSSLSGAMSALVRTFGVGEAGPVYQLSCSMAFGGRGASWLQKDDQPRNPYFGAAMPACADRVERLTGPRLNEEKGAHHHE